MFEGISIQGMAAFFSRCILNWARLRTRVPVNLRRRRGSSFPTWLAATKPIYPKAKPHYRFIELRAQPG